MSTIDWTDPECPVSSYFTVKEAIFLPRWSRLASMGDGLDEDARAAIVLMFQKMDVVREFVGRPIRVHEAYRSIAYNREIGGAPESAHVARRENGASLAAVDFDAKESVEGSIGESCDALRSLFVPKLEEWGLRMEDRGPMSPWIHLDCRPVHPGMSRFFKP